MLSKIFRQNYQPYIAHGTQLAHLLADLLAWCKVNDEPIRDIVESAANSIRVELPEKWFGGSIYWYFTGERVPGVSDEDRLPPASEKVVRAKKLSAILHPAATKAGAIELMVAVFTDFELDDFYRSAELAEDILIQERSKDGEINNVSSSQFYTLEECVRIGGGDEDWAKAAFTHYERSFDSSLSGGELMAFAEGNSD